MIRFFITLILLLAYTSISSQDKHDENEPHHHDKIVIHKSEYGLYDEDMLSKEFHEGRREVFRKLMPEGSMAVIFSGPIRNRSNDVDFEFHQNPDFYYLTGLLEPNAMLLIFKNEIKIKEIKTNEVIFVQARNKTDEVWNGKRLGVEGVKSILGFDMVLKNSQFENSKIDFKSFSTIFYHKPAEGIPSSGNNKELFKLIEQFNNKTKNYNVNTKTTDRWLAYLREIKLPEEIVLMRKAVDITCIAQIDHMKKVNENMTEYQSEAIIEYNFKYNGAEYTGYPSIVGSGENSCILHYISSRRPFVNKDLVLCDVGAEYHGYTADVTRTVPVNGKYTKEQKAIYDLVLKAQSAGIDECIVGKSFWAPHRKATEIIAKGLVDLGIIKDESEVKKYFLHGTSHYLGLDVHDMGTYGKLKENSIITVEPGIYIPENSDCDPKWWNIGIRIEDDILITSGKPENLSDCIPRTTEEIEALMAK